MKKKEFLNQLEKELQDLNKEERTSALKYYEDYFEDAGEENEEDVIKELGTPESVAEVIKKDNIKNNNTTKETQRTKEPLPIWAIVLIAIFFFPVILPLIIAFFGTVFGLFMGLVGIFIGLVCAGIGIFISGIATIVFGIISIFTSSLSGLLILGVGFILLGIGSILTLIAIKVCTIVIPHIIRGIVSICRFPFRNRGVNR